jgi:rhodanese-related sulfurtransferase
MAQLVSDAMRLDPEPRYLLVCARGARSLATAQVLTARGWSSVRSLRGGIERLYTVA